MLEKYTILDKTESQKTRYISEAAPAPLLDYIVELGVSYELVAPLDCLPSGIASHADLQLCRLGYSFDAPVLRINPSRLGSSYPADVPYNAACTGKYLICNKSHTAPELLEACEDKGMKIIDVKQGYAKCSCVVVDGNSIITYDRGIASRCLERGLSVLLVSTGNVLLEGYNTGFIGGASGRIGDTLIFNGDLSAHPDFNEILGFIEERNLHCKYFKDWELCDIGSII